MPPKGLVVGVDEGRREEEDVSGIVEEVMGRVAEVSGMVEDVMGREEEDVMGMVKEGPGMVVEGCMRTGVEVTMVGWELLVTAGPTEVVMTAAVGERVGTRDVVVTTGGQTAGGMGDRDLDLVVLVAVLE